MTNEELLEELQEIIGSNSVQVQHLKEMLATPGWALFDGVLKNTMFMSRAKVINERVDSLDAAIKVASMANEAKMLEIVRKIPYSLIEDREKENMETQKRIVMLANGTQVPENMSEFDEHSFQ